jgi:GTP cyclohydrolase IA
MTVTSAKKDRAAALMRRGISQFLKGVLQVTGEPARGAAGREMARIPRLVARAWREELLAGYGQDPARILAPLPARSSEDLVAVRGLEFASVCAHHLLPFQGQVHIAYAPAGRITGLSRLGRLVDCLSRRLQLQESLTRQIADAIQEHLAPHGAACVIEASHTCMTIRAGRKAGSGIVTAAFTGVFRRSAPRRREAMSALGMPGYRGRRR